jgi:tripartite-type tricarboxylate transporter receptor subunit TctC
MQLARRRFLHLAAGAAALPAMLRNAQAQTYPSRPVRIIVGYPAGGVVDVFARLIGQCLSEQLGQPFIIEDRPGAGGNLAAAIVVKAPPDGYTLLMITTSNTINATFYDNLNFNFITDIAPVGTLYRDSSLVMVVNPSFPAKTLPEFIAYAKGNPGKISMGSAGVGSPPHVFGELFQIMAGIRLLHVPYRGQPQVLTDLLGGQVQVTFDPVANSIGHVQAGRLRALGVTRATRVAAFPDIPTIGEFVPGYEASGWQGIGAPKNTPPEIIEKLNREIGGCLAEAKMEERFTQLGYYTPFASSPGELTKYIAEDTEKWAKVIRAANIKRE